MSSGYTFCKCRDCFELVVSNDTASPDLCDECEAAQCAPDSECSQPVEYESEELAQC